MTKKEKLCYIAGIIDGEGYLGISRVYGSSGNICFYARITVHMKDKIAIKFLCDFYQLPVKETNINLKKYYSLYVTKPEIIEKIINSLLPYLTVKKKPALLLKKLIKNKKQNPVKPLFIDGHFRGSSSVSKPIQDYRASLFHQLKQIQGYGSR